MTRQGRIAVRFTLLLWAGCIGFVGSSVLLAQTISFDLVGSIPGGGDLVELQDDLLYLASDKEFIVVDLSDQTLPRRLGTYMFPEQIWGFRLSNDRAYVGANFFGLGILDISERGRPELIGSYKSLGQTKIGAVVGGTAALIDHMEGLVFVNVSNESEPTQIGSYYLDGYARDVVISGSIAYAVDSPTGLYVFDLVGPGPWDPVGILHSPSSPQRSLEILDLPGGVRILCGVGGGGVQVYDVTDPTAPTKVLTFETSGQANGLSIEGSLVYVANGSAGLQVLDLSSPTSPRIVAEFPTDRPVRDVAVSGSLVVLVVGDGEYEGHDREVIVLRRSF